MLKAFIKTKNPAFWVYLHLLLGLVFAFVGPLFMVWFVVVFLSSVGMLAQGGKEKQTMGLIFFMTYLSQP